MILVFMFFLWDSPVVYPVKMLVVFFHESSHGLVALLTGGRVASIKLDPFQGGACYTAGGSPILILSAGYLGSLIWGGIILTLAARTRFGRLSSLVLGSIVVVVGLIFVRPLVSFGQLFVVAAGVGLYALGSLLPEQINDMVLRVIGLTSCMYAPLDIKADVLDRPYLPSDAVMLAEITGISSFIWGLVWIVIACACTAYFLVLASKPKIEAGLAPAFTM